MPVGVGFPPDVADRILKVAELPSSSTGTTGKGNEGCSLSASQIEGIIGAQPAVRLFAHLKTVRDLRREDMRVARLGLDASTACRIQSNASETITLPDTLDNCVSAFCRELHSFGQAWNALKPAEHSLLFDRALHPTSALLPIHDHILNMEWRGERSPAPNALCWTPRAVSVFGTTRQIISTTDRDKSHIAVRTNPIEQLLIS